MGSSNKFAHVAESQAISFSRCRCSSNKFTSIPTRPDGISAISWSLWVPRSQRLRSSRFRGCNSHFLTGFSGLLRVSEGIWGLLRASRGFYYSSISHSASACQLRVTRIARSQYFVLRGFLLFSLRHCLNGDPRRRIVIAHNTYT
jgi:hypothetical protein